MREIGKKKRETKKMNPMKKENFIFTFAFNISVSIKAYYNCKLP